jgi:hypothetical protein
MIPLSALVAIIVAASQLSSLVSSALGSLSQVGLPGGFNLLTFPQGFLADVTIEEKHRDETVITENPLEQGAPASDHAYQKPAMLSLRIGYSNSNPTVGDPLYVDLVYALLLQLQQARVPFGLVTTKRLYSNMLITALATFTDEKWANAMIISMDLKQLILVNTQVVSVPPSQNMAAPGVTGATNNTGQSALGSGGGFNSSAGALY